jgi:hypothetical protein
MTLFSADRSCIGDDFLLVDRQPDLINAIRHAQTHGHDEILLIRNAHTYQCDISCIEINGVRHGTVLLLFDITAKEEAERKAAEKARLAQEKPEKEAATQKEALLAEARAHLINACVAYSEAYGEEITDEDIKKLEQELIGMEKFLEKMMNMKSGDLDLSGLFGLFGF